MDRGESIVVKASAAGRLRGLAQRQCGPARRRHTPTTVHDPMARMVRRLGCSGGALLSLSLGVGASCTSAPSPDSAATPSEPPNIIFIMADDLGYGDIGPYGQTRIQTPSLDRMARQGLRFTQFYAGSPVCAPSRAVLMTGLHTGHVPIRGNQRYADGQQPLPAESVTLAEVLSEAGYTTGATGKWGLGGPGTEGVPTRQGFDTFYGYLDQSRAHFFYPEFVYRDEERVPLEGNRVQEIADRPGAGWPLERGRYSHDAIAEEALDFIDRHRDERFFLYVPFTIPHAELQAPEDAYTQYLNADGTSIFPEEPYPGEHYSPQAMPRATFAAMVSRMDRDVGRILDKLETLGLDQNTIVFFTSDNGPHIEGGGDPEFFDSNRPLRGLKRDVYEGGIRVPMIAWGPSHVPAGVTSHHVWAMWDVLPTLAELANARALSEMDGLNMASLLSSSGESPVHRHLYWEFHEQGGKQAVRRDDWKAVRLNVSADPNARIELYDLASDPGEQRNVAARHPDVVRELAEIMASEHTDSELFPALNGLGNY
ncbi:MAG: arylsulfatase [Longimicrobiales bacterium]